MPTAPPDPPPQERAPTLQGTLSHSPTPTLARIAAKTGTPVSQLATLTVLGSRPELYDAVLEYAALCDAPHRDTHHPLFVHTLAPQRRSDDSDSDSDLDLPDAALSTAGKSLMRQFSRMSMRGRGRARFRGLASGRTLRRRRVPVPRFELGLGETSIVWPPPTHLSAEYIVAERERKRKARKAAAKAREDERNRQTNGVRGNGDPSAVKDHRHSDASVQADVASDHADQSATPDDSKPGGPKGDSLGAHDNTDLEEHSQPLAEKEVPKRYTIFLSHYSVGEPKATEYQGIKTYKELLLVSADGPERLRIFAKEIIKWHMDKEYRESDGTKFALYRFKTHHSSGIWENEGMKHSRPPSSVILPEGQMDSILTDVGKFLSPDTRKWYISHGLPHRRSYLFYGHPGTGKTSTIRAIASTFRLNCCFLSMTTASFSNQTLGDALSNIPENALIVLEDVDSLFNEDRMNEQGASLTFSGLLNALDGLISATGVITVMTTNDIDRLDKALIRGGRVDRRFLFNRPNQQQLEQLFQSFYPDATKEHCTKFSQAVLSRPEGDEARSIATLQQLFIDQRERSADECFAAVHMFFEDHFPHGTVKNKQTFYT